MSVEPDYLGVIFTVVGFINKTSKTKFYKHQPKKLSRFELSKKRKKGKKEKKS